MRSLVLILALAIAFGAAAAWQSRKVEALKSERARAEAIANGLLAQTPSGEIPAGWAVVTIGRPSGQAVEPESSVEVADFQHEPRIAELSDQDEGASLDAPQPPAIPVEDGRRVWELNVAEGQSLSSIAAAHYGSAAKELVDALARHNALASPDELRVGQRLELPPLDVLLGG